MPAKQWDIQISHLKRQLNIRLAFYRGRCLAPNSGHVYSVSNGKDGGVLAPPPKLCASPSGARPSGFRTPVFRNVAIYCMTL